MEIERLRQAVGQQTEANHKKLNRIRTMDARVRKARAERDGIRRLLNGGTVPTFRIFQGDWGSVDVSADRFWVDDRVLYLATAERVTSSFAMWTGVVEVPAAEAEE